MAHWNDSKYPSETYPATDWREYFADRAVLDRTKDYFDRWIAGTPEYRDECGVYRRQFPGQPREKWEEVTFRSSSLPNLAATFAPEQEDFVEACTLAFERAYESLRGSGARMTDGG